MWAEETRWRKTMEKCSTGENSWKRLTVLCIHFCYWARYSWRYANTALIDAGRTPPHLETARCLRKERRQWREACWGRKNETFCKPWRRVPPNSLWQAFCGAKGGHNLISDSVHLVNISIRLSRVNGRALFTLRQRRICQLIIRWGENGSFLQLYFCYVLHVSANHGYVAWRGILTDMTIAE